MAYYSGVGDYYRGGRAQGDYYRGRGDPILGGIIAAGASLLPKALPFIKKVLPKVLKTGAAVAGGAATAVTIKGAMSPPAPPPGMIPVGGAKGTMQRLLPGGATGFRKRRRLNPTNPKALRRALRRVSGFAKLAQRTKRDIGKAATAAGVRRGAPKKRR